MRKIVLFLLLLLATPLFAADRTRVIVEFRGDVARAKASRDIPRMARQFSRLFSGATTTLDESEIARIAKLPYVRRVHLDGRVQAQVHESVPDMRIPLVWETYGSRGNGRTVAIVDTGIDYTHPALAGRMTGGYDFVNDDADPMDDHGHGTHVAGIVAAVVPDAKLLAYKVLDATGGGADSAVIAALERAVDPNQDGDLSDRADVINLSLGRVGAPDDATVTAVENAVRAGAVVVIAAGNDGQFFAIGSPGLAPSAITVGAIDRAHELAAFSSKGPAPQSLLLKPEVVAPGVNIVSAKLGGGEVALSGTSMATPHVAGLAALLRAVHPQWSVAEIKSAIVTTSIAGSGEPMAIGSGRADALAAASATLFASPASLTFGRTDGSTASFTSIVRVSLTNRSAAAKTLTLAEATGTTASIAISMAPVTLAPGETKEVPVTLEVTNAGVPAPFAGSLSFGGSITIAGGDAPMRLPWAFVKAARLRVNWSTAELPFAVRAISKRVHQKLEPPFGTQAIEAIVPLDEYMVEVRSRSEEYEPLLLEYEAVDARRDVELSASPAAAKNVISFETVNEQGAPINGDCTRRLTLAWPEGYILTESTVDSSSARFLVSDLAAIRGRVAEFCADEVTHAIYASSQLLPAAVDRNIAVRNVSSDWSRHPVRLHGDSDYLGLLMGTLTREPTGHTFAAAGVALSFAPELTLFLTRDLLANEGNAVMLEYGDVRSAPLRRIDGGLTTSTAVTLPPFAHVVPTGATMQLGAGPRWPRVLMAATPRVEWLGVADEVYKVQYEQVLGDDRYEAKVPGSKLLVQFDRERADPVAPTLTSVRLVPDALVFSAEDLVPVTGGYARAPIDGGSVAASWRAGGGVWMPLPVAAVGAHYRVELGGVPAGAVELRVAFADPAGNRTEWVGEHTIVRRRRGV